MTAPHRQKPDPAVMAGLRERALTITAEQLEVGPTLALPHVFAMLMETGFPEAVATLAVFADGTTSLYFSNGGGVLGAGEHESVRAASAALLGVAEQHLARLSPATATAPPAPGRVHLFVRTYGGTFSAAADEEELGREDHPLSPLFLAGHRVITQMRRSTPA